MVTISVITPSFNRADFICSAVESVLAQNYESFEHIIVDGGSTDETLSLLKAYPHLRVVSEPDRGVYDALNKGIALAQGQIIVQLNSDDYLEPKILNTIFDLFTQNPGIDAISAGARVFESSGNIEKTLGIYTGIEKNELPFRVTLGAPIFNAWFFRKDLFRKIGPYSLEFALTADRDFLIRCYLGGFDYITVHETFYHYCQHPFSLTMNSLHDHQDRVYKEIIRLAEKYITGSNDRQLNKYCLRWRDRAFIELFASEVLRRNPRAMMRIMFDAVEKNPIWPLILIAAVPLGIVTFIKKRYV